jgi:hypothetical protein
LRAGAIQVSGAIAGVEEQMDVHIDQSGQASGASSRSFRRKIDPLAMRPSRTMITASDRVCRYGRR